MRARLAAHLLHGVGKRHAARRDIIDLDDQVVGLDAGTKRRCFFDGGNDLDEPVFDADFDPEPAELALRRNLQLAVGIGVEEIGMRIEAVDHAIDRLADELVVGNGLDIIALDPAEHGRKELQVIKWNRKPRFLLRHRRKIEAQQETKHCAETDQTRLLPTVTHRQPRISHAAPRAARPPISTPKYTPVFRSPKPLRS